MKLISVFLIVILSLPLVQAQPASVLSPTSVSSPLPAPVGYVNDFAGVLSSDQLRIEQAIQAIEKETSVEIAVVTIPRLPEGYDPLTYSVELFEKWGVGKRGADNGLLLFLSIEEKKWRIEVGYGLEPIINDAKAGRIGRETLEPAFQTGEYGPAVYQAVLLIGEEITTAQERGLLEQAIAQIDPLTAVIVIVIVIVAIVILVVTGNGWLVWLVVRLLLMVISKGKFGGGRSGGGGAGN